MNNELNQRMQVLRTEMAQLEKMMQAQQEAAEGVRQRISSLRQLSRDPQYDRYLEQLLHDLDSQKATPEQVAAEVERTYLIYQERISRRAPVPLPDRPSENPLNQSAGQPSGMPLNQSVSQPSGRPSGLPPDQFSNQPSGQPLNQSASRPAGPKASGLEFTIGIRVLSLVGALFLLMAFITFSLNYLTGIFQGIMLYVVSAVVILLSELLLQKRVPKFAHGITGLGIAALYAATIINYLYLRTMGTLVAGILIIAVAVISLLIGRKRDSTGIRLISLIGCYICFFQVTPFDTALEFMVAMGILLLVSLMGVFFPNQKHKRLIHQLHMGFNTLFTWIFSFVAMGNGVDVIYVILFVAFNIILLNIVYLQQEKVERKALSTIDLADDRVDTALFCLELGISGLLILGLLRILEIRMTDGFLGFLSGTGDELLGLMQQRVTILYYCIISTVLMLAISIFFAVFNREQRGKTIQYYFFMSFALLLLNFPIDFSAGERIGGMFLLLMAAKLLSGKKEREVMNVIITVFAFVVGLYYYDEWPAWLLVGAFVASIFFIRRWWLFYQYTISLFLVFFFTRVASSYDVFQPMYVALFLLFVLVPVFHWTNRRKGEDGPNSGVGTEKVYNVSNFICFFLLNMYTIFGLDYLAGTIITVIGVLYIILILTPKFYLEIRHKYLLLAGYLVFMIYSVRIGNPVVVSVLLMIIAIGCVGIGFMIGDKAQRLCGLVLALFVCLKMILYDFRAEPLQRVALFLIVGVIVLLISLIYIQLEKTRNRRMAANVPTDVEQLGKLAGWADASPEPVTAERAETVIGETDRKTEGEGKTATTWPEEIVEVRSAVRAESESGKEDEQG